MPRISRQKSEAGIYHVMLRGIDRAQLFYDEEDHLFFLDRLNRYKNTCGFKLFAYALMGNHVHLLVKESDTGLSRDLMRLTISYAYWFNEKYDRSGHLFQNRFKSEAIANDGHLLSALRYILNNPVRVGLPIAHWTSYEDYLATDKTYTTLTDTDFILEMFSPVPERAKSLFLEFLALEPEHEQAFIEYDQSKKLSDADAFALIKEAVKVGHPHDIADMDKEARDRALLLLKEKGLSVRRLARLTGINRGVIQRARSE